jgi:Xaa-Pro aminopeptidase
MPPKSALPNEVKLRLKSIRQQLNKQNAGALLVTDMENIRYLSGFTGTEATLIITRRSQYVLADSRYMTQAGREAKGYIISEISSRNASQIADLVKKKKVSALAFEAEGMTHGRFLEIKKAMTKIKLVRFKDAIIKSRAIKTSFEVLSIKKAADIAAQAFDDVLCKAKPGVKESSFALFLETRMRELGSGQAPFTTIVASGKRGALPHGVASDKKIKKGELVTVDFGAIYNGYQSDQTITFCLGKATKKQKLVYNTVKDAHDLAMENVKAGVRIKKIDGLARDFIKNAGFGKYFGHGLGHGVGLSTHEAPSLSPLAKGVLEEGMIITIEPGIYIPGWGGVRIEDMLLVKKGGYRLLTSSGRQLQEI